MKILKLNKDKIQNESLKNKQETLNYQNSLELNMKAKDEYKSQLQVFQKQMKELYDQLDSLNNENTQLKEEIKKSKLQFQKDKAELNDQILVE